MNGEMGRIGIFYPIYSNESSPSEVAFQSNSRDQSGDVKELI